MSFLTKFSLRNPVALIILSVLIMVGGLFSATRFKQESMPDLSLPYLFVTAIYPGASPQEVLNQVTLPMEQALKNVEGVKNVYSDSANSIANIRLEFDFSDDIALKKSKVEEAVSGVKLPTEVAKPAVNKVSTASSPIIYTTVSAKAGTSAEELQDTVLGKIVPALQGLDGVGGVQTLGLQSEDIYIGLDPAKMEAKKVAFQQVAQVLQANNLAIPLGEATFDQVKGPVQVTGRIKSLDELKNTVILPVPEVKLQDIADVRKGTEQRDSITRTQGQPAIAVNVIKNGDANTVEVAALVHEEMEKFTGADSKVNFEVFYDSAEDVKESVNGMAQEGLLGALFASVLILFFLRNIRATIIAVVSIPLSILIALTLMKYFTDITLNVMTLGGMAVAVGRVVDDSIVVIENIVRRLQTEKVSRELLLEATREVGAAITSSTITTIAVFAPLGLVGGMIGMVFAPFAATVVFSLLASLLVAVTVVPMMAYLLMGRSVPKEHTESSLSRGYTKLLNWSLNHKALMLILSFALFLGSLPLAAVAGFTFMPEQEKKMLLGTLTMAKGTPIEEVDKLTKELDDKLRQNDLVLMSQVNVGSPKGEFDPITMTSGQTNKASWFISVKPETDLKAFIKEMKEELAPQVAGSIFDLQDINASTTGAPAINVIVTGNSMDDIRKATEKITATVQEVEGTDGVRNTLVETTKGVDIQIRPADALKHGLTTIQAAQILRPFLAETKLGKIGDGKQSDDIYLTLGGDKVDSVQDIEKLTLVTPLGQQVTVKDIADVKLLEQPGVMQLLNGEQYATITGSITEANTSKVNMELMSALDGLSLPDGVQYNVAGNNKEIEDMMKDMGMAILVAIGMVYIVMVVAFGGAKAPFAILFSLPFALIGALLGTVITGQPISVASMIGILMLIGIVVTNAIVLIDRVQQQVEKGLTIRDSLLEAGKTRLRPILMTAIATICALSPLALGMGGGVLISKGLAVVVIGGLITSTLLTLLIVPIMYELLHRKRVRSELKAQAAHVH